MTDSRTPASARALFERLWSELVSLVGTTATATLVRRSIKRAATRIPELAEIQIERKGLEYTYALPESWRESENALAVSTLRRLYAEELDPLLRELTGAVVRRRLASVPELAAIAMRPEEETR